MSSFIPSPGWKPNLNAIPQFTDWGSWAVDISWHFLEKFIASQVEDTGLDLDPDFQRAHVWTPAQQVAFVEFKLQGGHSGSSLLSNCTGFHIGSKVGPHVLVDGKQRLEAVRKFMRGELRAFGHTLAEYGGTLRPTKHSFRWHINDLPDRASVLKWYCEINAGGTPHTVEEIQRVRDLLQQEEEKKKVHEHRAANFWKKVDKNGNVPDGLSTSCWNWVGALAKKGYGNFKTDAGVRGAHVVSFEMAFGKLPEGKQVNHYCHRRRCVRPEHLYAGTQQQNIDDMHGAGRALVGEKHGMAKLSNLQVIAIKNDPRKQRDIARSYKVSNAIICLIKNGKIRRSG